MEAGVGLIRHVLDTWGSVVKGACTAKQGSIGVDMQWEERVGKCLKVNTWL